MSERIAKLVLLLSSDNDGEVVAAARAMARQLKSEGLDWHDVAARLGSLTKAQATPPKRPSTPAPGSFATVEDIYRLQEIFANHFDRLKPQDKLFIRLLVMVSRTQGKAKLFLTLAQKGQLMAIYKSVTE